MFKARLVAPIAELIAKSGIGEGTAPIVHKERQVAARRAVNDPLQCGQDRQREPLGLPIASLVLGEGQLPALGVLLSESDDVRTPLSCEQQERQREPRLAPYRVTLFELLNFFRCPCVETLDRIS